MVHRRQIDMDLDCDFFSHPILHPWNIADNYVRELREDLGRETPWEWFQRLAEKVEKHEAQKPALFAFIENKDWA